MGVTRPSGHQIRGVLFSQRLYAIADADAAAARGWRLEELALAYLEAGARLVQIRGKKVGSGPLLQVVDRVVARARELGGTVIVNDRADVLLLSAADGVHLGQTDLSAAAVRRLVGAARLIGLSTHTRSQAQAALGEPIDYVAVGPVFPTSSKETGVEPVGLELVRQVADLVRQSVRPLPVVAIGGITLDRARHVWNAGADAVAVIGDLLGTGNPRARVQDYLRLARQPQATNDDL